MNLLEHEAGVRSPVQICDGGRAVSVVQGWSLSRVAFTNFRPTHLPQQLRVKAAGFTGKRQFARLDAMHALVRDGVAVRTRDRAEVAGALHMHQHFLANHPLLAAWVRARNRLERTGGSQVAIELRNCAPPRAALSVRAAHPQLSDDGL